MIADLITQYRVRTRVGLDDRNATSVVHDMQRFARRRVRTERAMHLIRSDVDRLRTRISSLVVDDFAYSTPGRVVRVVRDPTATEVGLREMVVRIPIQRHRRDAGDASVRIVPV